MNIAWWKISAFVLVIVALSWGIFPTRRDMAAIYLQSDDLQKAKLTLDTLLAGNDHSFATTMLAANIALRSGDIATAHEHMEEAHKLNTTNIPMLEKLVQFREWTRNPRGAATIREEILLLQPQRPDLLRELAQAYRYFGMPEQESLAIARLVLLPPDSTQPAAPADAFNAAVTATMRRLARQRMSEGPEPYRDQALSRLYVLVSTDEVPATDEASNLEAVGVILLPLGLLEEAATFSTEYDKAKGDMAKGDKAATRKMLADAMGWLGLNESMPDFFAELFRLDPFGSDLAQALMDIGNVYNVSKASRVVADHLERLTPDRFDVRLLLAELDLQEGKPDRALTMLRDRLLPPDVLRFEATRFMLDAAATPDRELRLRMLAATGDIPLAGDAAMMRARAKLLASLGKQAEGLELYLALTALPNPTADDVTGLLLAAATNKDTQALLRGEQLAKAHLANDVDVARALASAYVAVGKTELGLPLLRRLALESGDENDAEALLYVVADAGNAALARSMATMLFPLHRDSTKVATAAAAALSSTGQYAAAYPFALAAARLAGGATEQLDALLRIAAATGQNERFRDALLRVAELAPASAIAAQATARALAPAATGEANAALQRIAAGSQRPQLIHWATIADEGGVTENAYRLYAALYHAHPADTAARDAFIRLAGWTNRPGEAAPVLGSMADANPGGHSAALAAATAWLDAGNPVKALPYARRALALQPDDMNTLKKAALIFSGAGQYAEALSPFERLMSRNALNSEEKLLLADTYVAADRPAEAIPLLTPLLARAALPRDPGLTLARALAASGRGVESAQIRRRLAAESPTDVQLLHTLGAEAYFAGDNLEAATLFERILRNRPDDRIALKGAAFSASARQDHQKAVQLLERYLRANPDDADARYRLAEELSLQGRDHVAARHYKNAVRGLKASPRAGDTSPAIHGQGGMQ